MADPNYAIFTDAEGNGGAGAVLYPTHAAPGQRPKHYTLGHVPRQWTKALPRVQPCYAIKCNPDAGIVTRLAQLQDAPGMDCASVAEITYPGPGRLEFEAGLALSGKLWSL